MVMKDDFIRMWVRDKGLPIAPSLPVMQTEVYFPHIDDPAILYIALMSREKYNMESFQVIENLPEFCSPQLLVQRFLSKAVGVAPREFVYKSVHFKVSQLKSLFNDAAFAQIVGKGSDEDIYNWSTSTPEITPVAEGAVRAERLYGFDKIGLCENLPADRKQRQGVYLSDL